jgi:hypothetical protein
MGKRFYKNYPIRFRERAVERLKLSGNATRSVATAAVPPPLPLDPSQGTVEKIQLQPLPPDHRFHLSHLGFEFLDAQISRIALFADGGGTATPFQLPFPDVKGSTVNAQFFR